MNNSSDITDAEMPERADAALESQLRTYFSVRSDQPPDAEMLWQRLAPRLEARDERAANGASSVPPAATTYVPTYELAPRPQKRQARSDGDGDCPSLPARVRVPSRRSAPAGRMRQTISGMAALAAVLLISLAAFALFHQFGAATTDDGNTVRSGQLVWHRITLPHGVVLREGVGVVETSGAGQAAAQSGQTPSATTLAPNASYQVASANGDVAYICETPAHGVPMLWRTVDAGAQWVRLPDLPVSDAFAACGVRTDANDAYTVVVTLARSTTGAANGTQVFALFDGASQWQRLNGVVGDFSSWHGDYYATRNEPAATPGTAIRGADAAGSPRGHLYVSTDGMRSWRAIDAPLIAENVAAAKRLKLNGAVGVEQVWVQPETGELLAQTYDGVLWRSTDHGNTWNQITLPSLPPASELTPTPGETISETSMPGDALVVVQRPIADHPFTLCALVLDQSLTVFNVAPLYCSTDSGQTWVRRPRPAVPQAHGRPDQFEMPSVMLPDGSLLAWDVTTIYTMPGNNAQMSTGRALGAIPAPRDPNNIPGGDLGVTAQGVVLWQPHDPQTLYVAQYIAASAAHSAHA